ncbi:MAG: DUF4038 domain-containing protein [Bacteroidetes bacterium]|nr:MAG: DUF4038 domain-containing protein [Bacteroidota bacterium]
MKKHHAVVPLLCSLLLAGCTVLYGQVGRWSCHELSFTSDKAYENPLYDLREFGAVFTAPSGRQLEIDGFWNGGRQFLLRFAPDETGRWQYETFCSDEENTGLHAQKGSFECVPNPSPLPLYQRGSIRRSPGSYHLTYNDGTPFFYTACTAWNGALKSTEEEWDTYLQHRRDHHYNVIQFVTTQWRGCEKDRYGEVAFTGAGRISLNPAFFQRLDKKVDKINEYGLVAAPVLLWALPVGAGRHLSPGYYLPQNEAILLAGYLVARYGGHQVIWILGGDGKYVGEYEQRWKNIGRAVFAHQPPGLVAQHPQGRSWIGEAYKDEHWLDIVGYQSSHSNRQPTVDWINKGPMAQSWDKLPPRPLINLEPNYEEIRFEITATDVRNASWWSIFATPVAGITYGANGIWPWIQREGELIENHGNPGGRGPSTWRTSIDFPGSIQIGYLSAFMQQFQWWRLRPAQSLLLAQPGLETYNHFIAIAATDDQRLVMAYTPRRQPIALRNPFGLSYHARWYDPVTHTYTAAKAQEVAGGLAFTPPFEQDGVLVLEAK